jgi:hypothetical protein
MKKLILCVSVLGIFLFGVATANVYAYSFYFNGTEGYAGAWDSTYGGYEYTESEAYEWSGYLIGVFDKNDSESLLVAHASYYLGETVTDYDYAKVDAASGTSSFLTTTASVHKPGEPGEWIGGTWSVDPSFPIGFYSVKASDSYALYFVDPEATSGYWSTIHLTNSPQPAISHFSGLSTNGAPVPEPATMLLFGSGLIGLAGLGRKFKKRFETG